MGRSRYSDTPVIDGRFYGTFRLPVRALGLRELDLTTGVRTFDYVYQVGDRVDNLAARFYGDESYWWVICLVNGVSYPFASGGLTPGRALKVPYDAKDVLDRLFK